jgi:hypothetical protein
MLLDALERDLALAHEQLSLFLERIVSSIRQDIVNATLGVPGSASVRQALEAAGTRYPALAAAYRSGSESRDTKRRLRAAVTQYWGPNMLQSDLIQEALAGSSNSIKQASAFVSRNQEVSGAMRRLTGNILFRLAQTGSGHTHRRQIVTSDWAAGADRFLDPSSHTGRRVA